jgi:hypothetical protein
MGQTGDLSGQLWKLTPLGDGAYRLTNAYLGTSRALDTYSGRENKPFMGPTDKDYSGQHWRLVPHGDGTYRLTKPILALRGRLTPMATAKASPSWVRTRKTIAASTGSSPR